MYTPRGCGVSELGDIEVVPRGNELHLFHLTLPNHDVVQHAVSRDGLSWTPLPAALRTGDPGAIDDDQIWTMSVTPRPHGDGYLMLYTALASADDGRVQRVAAATSSDLIHWEKSDNNPVSEADPRWYESQPGPSPAVSWRDPKATRVGDRYLATICAREASGPLPRRGCVGLMTSDDLEQWEVQPPLFAPHRYWDLECPQLFQLQNRSDASFWFLTAAIMEDRSQRYWAAESATGPFRVPWQGDLLAPPGHYAARVAHWHGSDLLFAWHQPKLAEGWMTSARTVDWVDARNPFGKFMAPPLELRDRGDGSLALSSFSGWDAYRDDEWQSPRPDGQSAFGQLPTIPDSEWSAIALSAMDLLTTTLGADDFVVEGLLTIYGPRGGLALRLDDAGSGLYIELTPGSRSVSLQRWGSDHNVIDGSSRHAYVELQRVDMAAPLAGAEPTPFRLLSVGPYVEFSLGGDVAIATMTGASGQSRWGIWIQDGTAHATDVRWAPMRRPAAPGHERSTEKQETTIG